MALPAGVSPPASLSALVGAPSANCSISGTTATGSSITCAINIDLNVGETWCYSFVANGMTEGVKTATASLVKPDSYAFNDVASTPIRVYVTCADPFFNGTAGDCPFAPGNLYKTSYLGPSVDSKLLNSSTEFGSQCCVSAARVLASCLAGWAVVCVSLICPACPRAAACVLTCLLQPLFVSCCNHRASSMWLWASPCRQTTWSSAPLSPTPSP